MRNKTGEKCRYCFFSLNHVEFMIRHTRRLFASYQTVERGKCIKNHVDNPSGLLAFPSLPLVLQLPP